MRKISSQIGMTLLELMIAITIVGIISAVAIPAYKDMTASSRFSDGKEDVYRVMAQQEKFFLNNLRYTTELGSGGIGYNVTSGHALTSPGGFYSLTAGLCDGEADANRCIRITAVGIGEQAGEDDLWMESDGDIADAMIR